jgi:hypothetical protein
MNLEKADIGDPLKRKRKFQTYVQLTTVIYSEGQEGLNSDPTP